MSWVICVGSSRIGLAVSRGLLPRQHQLMWDCASQRRGASLFLAVHPRTGSVATCRTFCFVFFLFRMEEIFCQGVHNAGTSLFTCYTVQIRPSICLEQKTKQQTSHTCVSYKYMSSHHIFVRVVGARESELKAIVFSFCFVWGLHCIFCFICPNFAHCKYGVMWTTYTVNTVGSAEKLQFVSVLFAKCNWTMLMDQRNIFYSKSVDWTWPPYPFFYHLPAMGLIRP